jgi:hypothetical protein
MGRLFPIVGKSSAVLRWRRCQRHALEGRHLTKKLIGFGANVSPPNGRDISTRVIETGGHSNLYALDFSDNFVGDLFQTSSDNGGAGPGTDITEESPCYCPGTLIRTKWIGRRSYSGRFVIGRKDILPVCIKAGALTDNVPKRNLWISPNHAMYLDSVLIEAKDLTNGVSIAQAERVEQVEYFPIELETHDVIIAEGALSESYIDDDNRLMFHNANEYRQLRLHRPCYATYDRRLGAKRRSS